MPDIFLSYSRLDQPVAQRFAEAFQQEGFSVWWDVVLKPGEAYDEVTEKALHEAKAVVVLWSKNSVGSRWVRAEATQGNENGTLIPVMIEPCKRPIMFELTHTADLSGWTGSKDDRAWLDYVIDVRAFVQRRAADRSEPALTPAVEVPVRAPAAEAKSIAVLPLQNLSPNPENAYFASGVHEEILDRLAKISDLKVIARAAVLRFNDTTKSPSQIARELNVSTIMAGSVRFAGNRVRISTQLVRAADDTNLWTETYQFALDDIFTVQSDVAQKVAAAMQATLAPAEKADLDRPDTGNTGAYKLYLQHRYQYETELARPTLAHDGWIEAGIRRMSEAVTLDPFYARGFAELGWLMWYKGLISPLEQLDALYDQALLFAHKAVAIDRTISRAYQVMHRVHFHRRQWDQWERHARKSVELPDADGSAAFNMAYTLLLLGQHPESFHWFDITLEKCPYFPYYWETAIVGRIGGRDYQTALQMTEKFRAVGGDMGSYHAVRAYALIRLGRRQESLQEFEKIGSAPLRSVFLVAYHDYMRSLLGNKDAVMQELMTISKQSFTKEPRITYCAAADGDIEAIFASFERSMQNHMHLYFGDLVTEEIMADPRWQRVEDYMRLPEASRRYITTGVLTDAVR